MVTDYVDNKLEILKVYATHDLLFKYHFKHDTNTKATLHQDLLTLILEI